MEQDQIEQLRAEMEGRQLISEWRQAKRTFFSTPENRDLDCEEVSDFLDGVAQKAALEEIQLHGRVTSTPDAILQKGYKRLLETFERRQNAKKPKQAEGKSESRDMTPDDYMAKQREHINRIRNPRL